MKDTALIYLSLAVSLIALAISIIGLWYIVRAQSPGRVYVDEQTQSAKGGNRWAQFNLWKTYQNGAHNAGKDQAKADLWLDQFVQGVYVVRFEPANGFHPRNATDYLNSIRSHTPQAHSADNGLGIASFFRTTKDGDRLVASFLSEQPDELQRCIGSNPDLKFISAEAMSAQSFIEYEKSPQQSL
jgi:hypothetical protein